MRCINCDKCNHLRRLMPPGQCIDCQASTAHSNLLCSYCSKNSRRCEVCRSYEVGDVQAHEDTKRSDHAASMEGSKIMTQMDLLRILFKKFTKIDSEQMSLGEFRNFAKQICTNTSQADLSFIKAQPKRGKSIDFDGFVTAIGDLAVRMYGDPLDVSLRRILHQRLVPMARDLGRTSPGTPSSRQRGPISALKRNRAILKKIYFEACGPHLHLQLDCFLKFCRRTSILPDLMTVADLKALFLRHVGPGQRQLNRSQFFNVISDIAGCDQFRVQLLLVKITSVYDTGTDQLHIERDASITEEKVDVIAWPRSCRERVENVFDYYYRREDTGRHADRTISSSTLCRFISDFNQGAPVNLRIDKNAAMLALAKLTKHTRLAVLDVDMFALIVEWHAAGISSSSTGTMSISAALDQITMSMQTSCLDRIAMRQAQNPLHDPLVCSTLLKFEGQFRRLFGEFATAPSRHQAGLRLGQNDLEALSTDLEIVPRLLTSRQVAWICRDMRACRPEGSDDPIDLDEFMEIMARIAMTAFYKGRVLGRDCHELSGAERLMLLIHFLDIRRQGTFLNWTGSKLIPMRSDRDPDQVDIRQILNDTNIEIAAESSS